MIFYKMWHFLSGKYISDGIFSWTDLATQCTGGIHWWIKQCKDIHRHHVNGQLVESQYYHWSLFIACSQDRPKLSISIRTQSDQVCLRRPLHLQKSYIFSSGQYHIYVQHVQTTVIYLIYRSILITKLTGPCPNNQQRDLCIFLPFIQCTVWVKKKYPPEVFWHFFPNGWEFLVQILHTYYKLTFLSMLEYKFLFNYLQLWRSYAILSATTEFKSCAQNVHHRPKCTRSDVCESRW